jgi:muramidase (phage lysozyme)
MSSKREQMLKMIGTIESENNYNIMTGGKRVPLTDMTVGDVLDMQSKLKGDTAAGRFQIKESSLRSLVFKPGKEEGTYSDELRNPSDFNLNTPFDEAAQDWAASALMDRRGFKEFEKGEITDKELAASLSKEWASLPHPDNGTNTSYYGGDGKHDNPTRVSTDDVFKVLNIVEGRRGELKPKPSAVAGEGDSRQQPLQSNSSGTPMR